MSVWLSSASTPPWWLFCNVLCCNAAYWQVLSVQKTKLLWLNLWWNSKPMVIKLMDRKYHTAWRKTTGDDVAPWRYLSIFCRSCISIISLCDVGFDRSSQVRSLKKPSKIPLAVLNSLSWTIFTSFWMSARWRFIAPLILIKVFLWYKG